ncbi:MAG: sulfotransferase family protein [Bacteroidota bacterium]
MSIQVIGAGFGRTGTMSLKMALEQLGYVQCYHMFELLDHPTGVQHWKNAMRGRPVDWEALFAGYQAVVDFPGCLYVEELMAAFPEAKVVLTVRDPESWWESASATILNAAPPLPAQIRLALRYPFVRRVRQIMDVVMYNIQDIYKGAFSGKPMDKETAIQAFIAHNAAIRLLVPPARLLEYEVKQGWEPLCAFLGQEIPPSEFPRINAREEFYRRIGKIYRA